MPKSENIQTEEYEKALMRLQEAIAGQLRDHINTDHADNKSAKLSLPNKVLKKLQNAANNFWNFLRALSVCL